MNNLSDTLPMLVGIVAICAPFAMVIILAMDKQKTTRERNKLQAEAFVKAVEHGANLPKNFFDDPKKDNKNLTKYAAQHRALILIAIGIGLAISFGIGIDLMNGIAVGVIPFLIGCSYLVMSYIIKEETDASESR